MIFGIEISSPEFTLSKKERASLKLSGVKTGDVIRAKVADLLPQGRAAFLVAGRRVIAKTDLPLTKGDSLLLEVIRGEGALSLKPAAGTQPAIQPQAGGGNPGLAALLAKAGADLELLSKIDDPGVKHIINTLALKSGRRDDNFLPRLIEQLGLTLEKNIGLGCQDAVQDRSGKGGYGPAGENRLESGPVSPAVHREGGDRNNLPETGGQYP